MTLPYQLNGISIQMIDDQVVIDKSPTILLTYSQTQQITVTVGDDVAQYVCGACGVLTETKAVLSTSSIQNYLNGYKSSAFSFW